MGWEGFYEVSSEGRVRSLDRTVVVRCGARPYVRRMKGRVLRQNRKRNGYLQVELSRVGEPPSYRNVHRLVLAAFEGPGPEGYEVCHNDGTRANNRLENLRYDTRSNNHLDRHKHDRPWVRGEQHHATHLTDQDIRDIRRLYPSVSQPALAIRFGVGQPAINAIVHRKTWKHVGSETELGSPSTNT